MHDDKLHMKMCDQAVVYKGRSPYVGADGYWYVWDDTTQAFKKTNTLAQGPQGEQGEQGPQGEAGSGGASTWDAVSGKPSTFPPSAHSHAWTDITNKPDSYTPASHTHEVSDVNGLSSALGNKVDKVTGKGLSTNDYTDADKAKVGEISQIKEDIGALSDLTTTDKSSLVSAINEVAASGGGGGTGGTTNYNDLSNKPQINGIALKGNKTGAYLGLASASHTHAQSDITGLADALAGKAASSHTHTATQVSGLASVATSGSYNDLLNKPSIPAATTVTQTITSGTEIGAVNGTKLYAPSGGSGGSDDWVFIREVTLTEETKAVNIETDTQGNSFHYKDALVYVIGPSTTINSANGYVRLKDGVQEDYGVYYGSIGFAPASTENHSLIEVKTDSRIPTFARIASVKTGVAVTISVTHSWGSAATYYNGITGVQVFGNQKLPAGTVIRVLGRGAM